MFSDDDPLAQARVPDAVIEEVTPRTLVATGGERKTESGNTRKRSDYPGCK